MRIYRFWRTRVVSIDGVNVHFKAGSNESAEHADSIIDKKLEWFRVWYDRNSEAPDNTKIQEMNALFSDGKTGIEYESPICEELCDTLDESNIVTRNRYGALVLNSENHMFLDIDPFPPSFSQRLWSLFGTKIPDAKTRIYEMIEQRIAGGGFQDVGFRVYETANGVRLLLSTSMYPVYSFSVQKLMYQFRVDSLYATLCAKQNCFRARLTPKPARIGMSTARKFRFPYTEDFAEERAAWLSAYEKKSQGYAVCRLVNTYGPKFMSETIQYHDRVTRAEEHLPLA